MSLTCQCLDKPLKKGMQEGFPSIRTLHTYQRSQEVFSMAPKSSTWFPWLLYLCHDTPSKMSFTDGPTPTCLSLITPAWRLLP